MRPVKTQKQEQHVFIDLSRDETSLDKWKHALPAAPRARPASKRKRDVEDDDDDAIPPRPVKKRKKTVAPPSLHFLVPQAHVNAAAARLPMCAHRFDVLVHGAVVGVGTLVFYGRHWMVGLHQEAAGEWGSAGTGIEPFRIARHEFVAHQDVHTGAAWRDAVLDAFATTNPYHPAPSSREAALFYHMARLHVPEDLGPFSGVDIGDATDWFDSYA